MVTASKARNQSPLKASGVRLGACGNLFLNHGSIHRFSAAKSTSTDATTQMIDSTLTRAALCSIEPSFKRNPDSVLLVVIRLFQVAPSLKQLHHMQPVVRFFATRGNRITLLQLMLQLGMITSPDCEGEEDGLRTWCPTR